MMKKHIIVILTILIALVSLSACGSAAGNDNPTGSGADSAKQTEESNGDSFMSNPAGESDAAAMQNPSETGAENDSTEFVSEAAGQEESQTDIASDQSVVYFTSDISAQGLVNIYKALGWEPTGKVAVKISTGEPPASNYLRPELIGNLVKMLDGTIVECNTAYGGSRSSAAMHKQVAEDHGFTAIADFDLLDEDGEAEWPVAGGTRLDKAIVGSHAENYSDWVLLSHFKGHAMAGFGGAVLSKRKGLCPYRRDQNQREHLV